MATGSVCDLGIQWLGFCCIDARFITDRAAAAAPVQLQPGVPVTKQLSSSVVAAAESCFAAAVVSSTRDL